MSPSSYTRRSPCCLSVAYSLYDCREEWSAPPRVCRPLRSSTPRYFPAPYQDVVPPVVDYTSTKKFPLKKEKRNKNRAGSLSAAASRYSRALFLFYYPSLAKSISASSPFAETRCAYWWTIASRERGGRGRITFSCVSKQYTALGFRLTFL